MQKMTKILLIPGSRHFNLPNHSTHGMTIFGLFYTKETQKAVKTSNKDFSFNWKPQTLMHGINERFSFTHNSLSLFSLWRMDNSRKVSVVINLFDARFSRFTSLPTRDHSFFRNNCQVVHWLSFSCRQSKYNFYLFPLSVFCVNK